METFFIDRERVNLLMQRASINTYTELSRRAGIHKNTLTKVLNGEPWQSETAMKIAKALGCHPLDMLTTTGFPSPNWAPLANHSTLLH